MLSLRKCYKFLQRWPKYLNLLISYIVTLAGHGTWQSQDACALSRHCEPVQAKLLERAKVRRKAAFPTASGVGTTLLFVRKGLEFAPQQMPGRYPITAGWTGEAGGRQMEKLPKWGLNSRTSGPEPEDTTTAPHRHTHKWLSKTCCVMNDFRHPL